MNDFICELHVNAEGGKAKALSRLQEVKQAEEYPGKPTNAKRAKADADEAPDHEGEGAPANRDLIKLCQGAEQHDGGSIVQHALPKHQVVQQRGDLDF